MSDLVQHYERSLPIWIHEDGFSRPPLLALHHNGETTMASMMIPQGEIFRVVMAKFMTDLTVKEVIFGVDRYTQPGQGTKYRDVLTVFWWQGERLNEDFGWKFGVVNYRPPPRTRIEPIDWDNEFWNDVMLNIVQDYYHHVVRRIAEAANQPGGEQVSSGPSRRLSRRSCGRYAVRSRRKRLVRREA